MTTDQSVKGAMCHSFSFKPEITIFTLCSSTSSQQHFPPGSNCPWPENVLLLLFVLLLPAVQSGSASGVNNTETMLPDLTRETSNQVHGNMPEMRLIKKPAQTWRLYLVWKWSMYTVYLILFELIYFAFHEKLFLKKTGPYNFTYVHFTLRNWNKTNWHKKIRNQCKLSYIM